MMTRLHNLCAICDLAVGCGAGRIVRVLAANCGPVFDAGYGAGCGAVPAGAGYRCAVSTDCRADAC